LFPQVHNEEQQKVKNRKPLSAVLHKLPALLVVEVFLDDDDLLPLDKDPLSD